MNTTGQATVPMSDHVARFWRYLDTETVRILVDMKRVIGTDAPDGLIEYWDGASFSDDVAKAIVASRSIEWQPIDTVLKDGTFIWLSDGFLMRIGYWYVVTADPSKEHWADFAKAEGTGPRDLAFEPRYWMPLPKSPETK